MTKRLLAGLALTLGLLGACLVDASPGSAAGATIHGCPSGAVCIYPQNKGWNNNVPSVELWSWGVHNLSNQVGMHYVINNQYDTDNAGWWVAQFCYGYSYSADPKCNGVRLSPYIHQPWSYSSISGGSYGNFDLTPINSISIFEP